MWHPIWAEDKDGHSLECQTKGEAGHLSSLRRHQLVKSIDCSSRVLAYISQHPRGGLKPSVAPVPGDTMSSSGLCRHCIHVVQRHTFKAKHPYTQIKNNQGKPKIPLPPSHFQAFIPLVPSSSIREFVWGCLLFISALAGYTGLIDGFISHFLSKTSWLCLLRIGSRNQGLTHKRGRCSLELYLCLYETLKSLAIRSFLKN